MRAVHEPRTIAEAVEFSRERLRSVSPTPWLDARLLAQHVTGLDASALIAYGDTRLEAGPRRRLFDLVERRRGGEPVAYIVGKKPFCGLVLSVDRRVLVPRPETEELVMACVADWTGKAATIADVGTGSGAIACALAHLLPDAALLATDISRDALDVARSNARSLGLVEQIEFLESDLFETVPDGRRFDVLIANLPYVGNDLAVRLPRSVADHEPPSALLGGPDGLAVYRSFFGQAAGRLTDRGAVYCECSPEQAAGLARLANTALPQAAVEVRKDLAGLDRMVICR
ncbi:MAG: peptide chain release factor N(5)-glutamine methyltransferase [Candidatus Eremiobacteraeota bacterium]|nr:peptide chain release factor N(5)-glutamine methyltransferase [Candidatus Eremiobacteraeota bacterium]